MRKIRFYMATSGTVAGKSVLDGQTVFEAQVGGDLSKDEFNRLLAEGRLRVQVMSTEEVAPKAELPTTLDPEKMSAADIKKELTDRKIEFSAKAKHPELIELLKAALQPSA